MVMSMLALTAALYGVAAAHKWSFSVFLGLQGDLPCPALPLQGALPCPCKVTCPALPCPAVGLQGDLPCPALGLHRCLT